MHGLQQVLQLVAGSGRWRGGVPGSLHGTQHHLLLLLQRRLLLSLLLLLGCLLGRLRRIMGRGGRAAPRTLLLLALQSHQLLQDICDSRRLLRRLLWLGAKVLQQQQWARRALEGQAKHTKSRQEGVATQKPIVVRRQYL
jgi:hypothetical protein